MFSYKENVMSDNRFDNNKGLIPDYVEKSEDRKKNWRKRKWWFKVLLSFMKGRYKPSRYVYLGEEIGEGALIICNHEGTESPMSFELYSNKPLRFWGTAEMNSGLVKMYKYQTRVYYHEKKHWNLHLARLFCLLASPLTYLYYKGLSLVSVYKDTRLTKTLRESMQVMKNGESIVVFPEDSQNGYLPELEGFFGGFATYAEFCLKKGMNVPIFVSYFKKDERVMVVDKPVYYADLKEKYASREEISTALCNRCNELGKMKV